MTDPSIDRVIDDLMQGRIHSRREFITRLSAAGLLVGGGSTLLAACGGVEGTADEEARKRSTEVTHPKEPVTRLNFANWPLYIDKKVIRDFEKETGAKVKYTEEINDNEEFFGKIRQPLAQKRAIGRDIIALTDWMAARLIRLGYVQPLDKKNIPNAKNLISSLQSPPWDKERNYSLPWQAGMTAIGYNKKKAGTLTSWQEIFDPKFKGRVSLLSDAREAANAILLRDGKDPASATIDDVLAAIEEIDKINRSGQIRRFTGNDYTTDLTKGNLWIAQAYSGDVIQLQADNPELEFLIPEEGATQWADNMQIPNKAENVYAAEVWMNYVYDPPVAAKIAAYVNYVTPVKGAKEELAKDDPELAENELIFPSEETLAKLHPYVNLDEAEERQMNEAMQAVVGA